MTSDGMESWGWPPVYDDAYFPPLHQPYWFPRRETMPEAQRNAAIIKRIRLVMAHAYDHAPFYRRRWDEAGIHPSKMHSLEDFEQVPVVTKAELRKAQADHPPFGDYLCVNESEVRRVHGTSGTTGRPTAFAITRDDWRAIGNAHARVMWGMGLRPSDTVMVASFFSLYLGSWGALAGAERLGARVIPFGAGASGQTLRAITWINEIRPTALYGTPSYALHLAEVARSEGYDPRDFGLRILFFSGEPGASIPSIRQRLENDYGALVFDSGSMAEMSPWMNLGETTARVGMLCWQDIVYTEVCDPTTYQRVPYGASGTPVYTHLERTGQPMIRLLSGDLTTWESGPSPCGRTYPILPKGIHGRIDDMFIVRGANIYPSAVDDAVTGIPNYGGEHRIVISRSEMMDVFLVQVEYDEEIAARGRSAVEHFAREVQKGLARTLGVTAKVQAVPPGTLERTEFKARRVIDNRDLFREVLSV
jgi:phenylacetate-CoA ligase